jgi:RNA polymerase sigma factor (sigma-70 family)
MTAEALVPGMTPTATALPLSVPSTRAASGEITDAELVAAVRSGDDRAFERLYGRYHRRIAAFIYGKVGDHGRAEDITQDVFMSALRRMRETDRPITFKPWVYEIAKNACIDQFRRSRRTEEISFDAEDGLGAADQGRLATTGPSPHAAVDQKMTLDHLCGAFGGLSDTHHQILVLRELEGLSYRQIGERLGMSRPSVESTLFRARRRLAEEYAQLVSGEQCGRVQAIIVGAPAASPGARDQRRMAAHLSHCQRCRRAAYVAGVDIVATPRMAARAKVAAFLPMPAFLRRRTDAGGDIGGAGSGHVSTLAQWSVQAGASVDPAIVSWVKAAAAAASIAVVGVGAGEGTAQLAGLADGVRPVIVTKSSSVPSGRAGAVIARRGPPVAVAGPTRAPAPEAARPAVAAVAAGPALSVQATDKPVSGAGVPVVPAAGAPSAPSVPIVPQLGGDHGATGGAGPFREPTVPPSPKPELPVSFTPPVALPVDDGATDAGAAAAGVTAAAVAESVAGIVGGR